MKYLMPVEKQMYWISLTENTESLGKLLILVKQCTHLTHRAANNLLKLIFTSAWIQHYFIKGMTVKTLREHYLMRTIFNTRTSEKFLMFYHYSLLLTLVCKNSNSVLRHLLQNYAANTHQNLIEVQK